NEIDCIVRFVFIRLHQTVGPQGTKWFKPVLYMFASFAVGFYCQFFPLDILYGNAGINDDGRDDEDDDDISLLLKLLNVMIDSVDIGPQLNHFHI
ncbi:hypothetical protein Anas_05479, partial [Armadillidium nasatum]